MRVIDRLKVYYQSPGHVPLTPRESAGMFGVGWTRDAEQMKEFTRLFVLCKDGVIRIRGTIAEFNAS